MSPAALAALWLAATAPETAAAPSSLPVSTPAPVSAPTPGPAPPPEVLIRQTYDAAQAQQGALDGAWRLADADGRLLYVFQLSDPGGDGPVEGAWRNPSRLGAVDSSGFLGSVRKEGDRLEIRLARGLFPPTVMLRPNLAGGWNGELIHQGPRRPVVMSRETPTSP